MVGITRRRMDFLRIIKQLYESTNLPVHYVRVAQLLGISKWSAYEMLKNLEKEGLVSSQGMAPYQRKTTIRLRGTESGKNPECC
jgi:Mn-dependent DtxR family transcriptional regulator